MIRRSLIAAIGSIGVMLACSSPAWGFSKTTFTWSGNDAANNTSWSDPNNWTGAAPTNNSTGDFVFPACSATKCANSADDLSGVNASSLTIDGDQGYSLLGSNPLSLGGGGLTLTGSTDTPTGLGIPITLNGDQTWMLTGGGMLTGEPVTGPYTLTLDLDNASLLLASSLDVGSLTVNGSGSSAGDTVGLLPGSALNGTSHGPVLLHGAGLLDGRQGSNSIGPLQLVSGTVNLSGASSLDIAGDVTADSGSNLDFEISGSGTTPGSDYTQTLASGNVNLGGAQLAVGEHLSGPDPCPQLSPGNVYTLIGDSSGTISGTFGGQPDGSTLPLACSSPGHPAQQVRINYTAHAVTATALSATSTAAVSAAPASPNTNTPVTLSTTVTAVAGQPTGTVEFDNNGSAIPGCSARTVDSSTGKASCPTFFTATSSPESLSATYTPAAGAPFTGSSTASASSLTVGKDPTATALTTSDATPTPGESVTYTATVTPADSGAAQPSGTVAFLDGGTAISGCGSQTLSAGMATCTVSYPSPGSHSITASYSGDANFSASSAAAQSESVKTRSSMTTISASPSAPATNQPVTLGTTVTTTSGSPAGTVEFDDHGTALPGCSARPVDSATGNATCPASFTAAGSPLSLTATYTPSDPTTAIGSSTPQANPLSVSRDGTAIALGTTSTAPRTGEEITYTATVTPADSGAAQPSGTVTFLDGSTAIPACASQPLSAGKATCTLSYASPGSHGITARYGGDPNFTPSDTPSTTTIAVRKPAVAITSSKRAGQSGSHVDPGIKLVCDSSTPCTVTEIARWEGLTVGSARLTIPGGATLDPAFVLNRLGLLLLSDHITLPVTVTIAGHTADGAPSSATKEIVLHGHLATFSVSGIHVNRDGSVSLRATVSAPGQVLVLLTAWDDNIRAGAAADTHGPLQPATERFVVGRATATATKPGVLTLEVKPDARGRALIAHHRYKPTFRLWVSYIPSYASQQNTGFYGLHISG